MLTSPVYQTPRAIEDALLRQARSHYRLSVHIPGGRWVTPEPDGRYAVRVVSDQDDNVVYRGTAREIAQRFGVQP